MIPGSDVRNALVAALASWGALVACEPSLPGGRASLEANTPIVVGADTLGAETVRRYLADALGFTSRGGQVLCSYAVLGQEGGQVYLATLCEELVATADSLESRSGRSGPVALVLDTLARPIRIARHAVPGDGGRHAADIREIFPERVQRRIQSGTAEHNRQVEALLAANREAGATYTTRPNARGVRPRTSAERSTRRLPAGDGPPPSCRRMQPVPHWMEPPWTARSRSAPIDPGTRRNP